MSALQIFQAPEGFEIRTTLKDGDPWFVASDVCRALDIANASLAVNGRPDREGDGLDSDERGVATVNTPSGAQEMLIVSESGLYSLVFKSRKPEAKSFKRWVTHEVIPSIRKAGGYQVAPLSRVEMARLQLEAEIRAEEAENRAVVATREKAIAEEKLEAAQPAIAFKERAEEKMGELGLQACAKKLELNFHAFKQHCLGNNILRILDGRLAPTHYALKMGYIRIRTTFAGFSQPMVTPKGYFWLEGKTKHLPRLSPRLELGFLDEGAA